MARKHRRKVRYAVIGLGNIAQVAVLPAFAHAREVAELAALISSEPEKLDEVGRRLGIEARGSFQILLGFEKVALSHVELSQLFVNSRIVWGDSDGAEKQRLSFCEFSLMHEHDCQVQEWLLADLLGRAGFLPRNRLAIGNYRIVRPIETLISESEIILQLDVSRSQGEAVFEAVGSVSKPLFRVAKAPETIPAIRVRTVHVYGPQDPFGGVGVIAQEDIILSNVSQLFGGRSL